MADKKNSYVMYKDWNALFLSMDENSAGKLIQAICKHQSGEEAEISNSMLNSIFEMIKSRFEKDNKKYVEICEVRAENARKSKEKSTKKANTSKSKQMLTNTNKCKQEQANASKCCGYDNDNDKDNDNDIENDIDLLKEKDNPKGLSKEKAKKPNFHTGTNVENAQKLIQANQPLVAFIKSKPDVWSLIKLWLEYKDERGSKHHYGTERGLNTVINRIVDNYKTYGYEAVKYAIDESISHEWQGLTWDVMERKYQPLPSDDTEAEKERHIHDVYMDTRSCYPLAENTEENYQAFKRRLARDSLAAEELRDEILAYVRWFETETDRQDIPTFAEYLDEGKR